MSDKSTISWTDASWPVTSGCAIVSSGCANCYAMRLSATRMKHLPAYQGVAEMRQHPNGTTYPAWTGLVRLAHDRLDWPKRWKRPRMIFVASMSDLFWEQVPDTFLDEVFTVMEETPRHIFQVLTKRPERMRLYVNARWSDVPPPEHIWLGTSVEDQRRANERVPVLLGTKAATRFLSCEPLLSSLDLTDWLAGSPRVAWVICGGESGPGHRPMNPAWARALRDQCERAGVAYWFKQASGARSEEHPYLDGWKYQQLPNRKPLRPPELYGSCAGENIAQAFAAPVLV